MIESTPTAPADLRSEVAQRQRVHLFGVPFDAVTLDETVTLIRDAAVSRRRLFLSTANVNYVVTAQKDAAFRDSLLHSDLCVADGTPLVWLSRLMGQPLAQRVAGSDIFEALRQHDGTPLKVYFFGGPPGAAERSAAVLKEEARGVHCVGFDSPGFGSIESMSQPDQLERINAAGADFVVVCLSAKKAQAWIEFNRHRLSAPVVSNFGAVVNFVAGTVKRSPRWMGSLGLEWLWRVIQEPALWRRYFEDGRDLLALTLRAWRAGELRTRPPQARDGRSQH